MRESPGKSLVPDMLEKFVRGLEPLEYGSEGTMEDTALPPDSMLETVLEDSVDMDLMDELLLEEVWMGTAEGSDLLRQGTSTSPAPFESSYLFSPLSEIENRFSNPSLEGYANNGGAQNLSSYRDSPQVDEETENNIGTHLNLCARDFVQYPGQTGEPGHKDGPSNWSIEAREQLGSTSLKDRLARTLNYIKESYGDRDVLVQIWVPMNNGDRQVLTTYGQPFSLSLNCQRLMNYRNVSMAYQFSAEENSKETLGLPGRVFLGKVPEWSPDVRYFTNYEYARVNYAQRYDVRGTLGIPIFQHGNCVCLGVMEVLMTTEKINYHSDLEQICNALQAVNLNSSDALSVPRVKMKIDSYLAALPEISSVMRAVCQAHGLPLAQTWIPCIQQGKNGCRHSDENYKDCVSTLDALCYVHDPFLSGFHEACSEHHLLRGQGVVGKAFMTNQPCFSSDIAAFSKTDYPLSHHARIFGLRAAVAIRLRSVHTGKADFVLEFFLPMNCLKSEEQKAMLNSLSVTVQQVCQSLRVVTTKELEDEKVLQVSSQLPSNGLYRKHLGVDNGSQGGSKTLMAPRVDIPGSESSYITNNMEVSEENAILFAYPSLEFDKQESQGFSVTKWGGSVAETTLSSEGKTPCYQESAKHVNESGATFNGHPCFSKKDKITERKRSKTEKTFSLQLLRQYFAGSLKDAAKSLGVCPTTLKRICRQHGITRWPSRKIKKVGHSLKKLQVVIDSVQGVDRTFQLSSLYANFPNSCGSDENNQKAIGKSMIYTEKQDRDPETSNVQHDTSVSNSASSSCSQASNSSHSSEAQECQRAAKIPIKEELSYGIPKRVSSELNVHLLSQEPPGTLARSQSLKSLDEKSGPGGLSSPCQNRHIGGQLRVKAMYEEEKVRFSLQPTWGIQELKQEITKRFHIGNLNSVDLKYLDDDAEWVLLTCDADLQECTDIYRTSSVHTIKILVHHSAQQSDISFGSGTITSGADAGLESRAEAGWQADSWRGGRRSRRQVVRVQARVATGRGRATTDVAVGREVGRGRVLAWPDGDCGEQGGSTSMRRKPEGRRPLDLGSVEGTETCSDTKIDAGQSRG
ncbi:hypothetical protein Taro_054192 [Colocasia esculenta]|uniref:Uncharacterized protein n=1 Tax=Colocasia esculenta TaxID=4460 RepID=A0A843XMW2_COLES|nr:hypothetical protein [Colocasia esculenta]